MVFKKVSNINHYADIGNQNRSLRLTERICNLSSKKIGLFFYISLGFSFIFSVSMSFLLNASHYPGTLEDTQLGFQAEIIKIYFQQMSSQELNLYLIAIILDYGFIIGYAGILSLVSLIFIRNFTSKPFWNKFGQILLWIGIGSAVCDVFENSFLIMMISNPQNFMAWLAIAHSSCALLKFILMSISGVWMVIVLLLKLYQRFFKSK